MHYCGSKSKVAWRLVLLLGVFVFDLTSGLPVDRLKGNGLIDVMKQDQQIDADKNEIKAENGNEGLKFEKEKDKQAVPDMHPHDDMKLDVDMAKKLEKLPVEKLKPVDHIDGVKLEQDGHVNEQYHKELFLGEAHEEFKSETFDEAEDKLKEIVSLADTNKDSLLDRAEMERWILNNMAKHFEEAKKENEHIFKHLDPDGDGFVTWKEYYVHFLLSRGFEVEKAIKHVKDYDDSLSMEQDDKDLLVSYKFKWTDADKEPVDNQLSKAEFMVFRHPEHSKTSLQMMVENVLHSVDTNNDDMISMEEYAALPPGEVEGKEFENMDKKWQEDRRKEFKTIMDINGDGQVTSEELKRYLDPTNPLQAKIETDSLISMIDDDQDEKLSMNEIMAHSEIFITSKLANFGANLHDEF